MVTAIIKRGKPFEDNTKGLQYEKTTDDNELVAGRIATKGTAQTQAQLATFGNEVIGVFDYQIGYQGQSSTGVYDDRYCVDGGFCKVQSFGPFTFNGCLNDGETVEKGQKLGFESGTGKLVGYDASTPWVAIALEDKVASGADETIEALYIGQSGSYVEEVVTVTDDVATLSYSNVAFVGYCEDVANDVIYSVSHGAATPTNNAICAFLRSAHTITFEASDNPATVRVGYFLA